MGMCFFSFLRKTFFFPAAVALAIIRFFNFRSQFEIQDDSRSFLPGRLLLSDGCSSRSLASACVCVSPLSPNGQSTSMAQAPICTDVHQTLDVHLNALSQIT